MALSMEVIVTPSPVDCIIVAIRDELADVDARLADLRHLVDRRQALIGCIEQLEHEGQAMRQRASRWKSEIYFPIDHCRTREICIEIP